MSCRLVAHAGGRKTSTRVQRPCRLLHPFVIPLPLFASPLSFRGRSFVWLCSLPVRLLMTSALPLCKIERNQKKRAPLFCCFIGVPNREEKSYSTRKQIAREQGKKRIKKRRERERSAPRAHLTCVCPCVLTHGEEQNKAETTFLKEAGPRGDRYEQQQTQKQLPAASSPKRRKKEGKKALQQLKLLSHIGPIRKQKKKTKKK
jgi:hypothetical protein